MGDLARVFGRIGLSSFGGPAAQIALMHRELVDRRDWLTEAEFLRALSFCMLLPGPEAMQLATYAGWKQRGLAGGLIGGGLFVLPGAIVIMALALAYGQWGQLPLVQAAFLGIKAAVVAIVIEAILRVGRRALRGREDWLIAGLAFLGIFAFNLPFPAIIALAALWGFVRHAPAAALPVAAPPLRGLFAALGIGLLLWAMPVIGVWLAGQDFLVDVGLFFSKLAVVTFGGAYAVLAYMTQEVVARYHWLSTAQMIDALGLAETTPGPLILVTEFVAVVGGAQLGGVWLGVAGGLLSLWVTFVPCFIWIFVGAPYLDWLAGKPRLSGALAAITAAVVGVIGNLSVWFAAHVLFARVAVVDLWPLHVLSPDWASLDPLALGLITLAAYLLLRRHWSLFAVLGLMAALGLAAAASGITGI